jgi:hypothetical protein
VGLTTRRMQASHRPIERSCSCGTEQADSVQNKPDPAAGSVVSQVIRNGRACLLSQNLTHPTSRIPVLTSRSPVSFSARAVTLKGLPTHRSPWPSVIHCSEVPLESQHGWSTGGSAAGTGGTARARLSLAAGQRE